MGHAKNIVYRYSDRRWSDEFEFDANGELTFKLGDILTRKDRNWLVDAVSVVTAAGITALWSDLVDPPVN